MLIRFAKIKMAMRLQEAVLFYLLMGKSAKKFLPERKIYFL